MTSKSRYRRLMNAAVERIASMDKIDNESKLPLDIRLRTVMSAIASGILRNDWSSVAEAQVMLAQIELKYRPADSKNAGPFDPNPGG